MSIEWNEDIKEENITSSTENYCDICKKPLDRLFSDKNNRDCPEWKQIQKSFKDMEEGNYKRYDSAEEYLKELESNA